MSDESMKGKVSLVTGATAGIGLGIAHTLASKGSSVVLHGICSEGEAELLIAEFTSKYIGSFHFVPGDFGETGKTEQFAKDVLAIYPNGIDILISNAGISYRGPIETLLVSDWQKSFNINVTAAFILIKSFIPAMKQKGWGRIILMSSQLGLIGEVEKSNYCACKAALLGIAKAVALESAEYGVTCNPICPSYVDAPMFHGQIKKISEAQGISYEEAKAQTASRHPMNKLIPIQEVADLIGYLCSDSASCISGSPIPIDCCNMIR